MTNITTQEKKVMPQLHLNNSPDRLNEYVKNTSKIIKMNKDKASKNITMKEAFIKLKSDKKESVRFKKVKDKESKEECNTRHLGRMMLFINDQQRPITITEIHEFTLLGHNIINEGLKFLVRYNIVSEIHERGRYFYKRK